MNLNVVSIATLCRAWLDAKRDEDEAGDRRKAIASTILERTPFADLEGTDRRELGDIKLVITHKMTRSVNAKALTDAWPTLPDVVQKSFKWKPDVDLKNLRSLEFASPDSYAIAAKYFTSKPATPSIAIETTE